MLFEHQKTGIEFLKQTRKAILADEMGLGKTRQAIIATKELTGGGIVICPASLKINWAREIKQVDPNSSISILNSGKIEVYQGGVNNFWLIANYDIISREENKRTIMEYLLRNGTLILDEAHYIKNTKSKRSKTAVELSRYSQNVFLLTGTPIMNRPIELFNLLKAIEHPLGNNWYGYALTYCGAFWQELRNGRRFLNVSGATNLDKLHQKIKPIYLRRTKEVLGSQLPQKIITNVEVEITPEHKKKYKEAWKKYYEFMQEMLAEQEIDTEKMENIELAKHIIEIQKLKQVASESKIEAIINDAENIIEQGEKIIIFTQYSQTLHRLNILLSQKKIKTVTLSGENTSEERQQAVDDFQNNEEIKVFIGNIKAAGVGITLTKASQVIFADLEWTPALHDQAEDRAHRIGATKMVNVYYYIAKETIEEDIIKLLKKKDQIIKTILEGKESRAGNMSVAKELIRSLSTEIT